MGGPGGGGGGGEPAGAGNIGGVSSIGSSGLSASPSDLDALMSVVPVVGPINAGMAMMGLPSLGSLAQGSPTGPGEGGPPDGKTKPLAQQRGGSSTPMPLESTPPEPPKPLVEESKRRRFGRKQTILGGDLASTAGNVYRATLLGQ